MEHVKPPRTAEQVAERLAQRAIKYVPKPRKGTRAKRKQAAIREGTE